jgi:protein TonB
MSGALRRAETEAFADFVGPWPAEAPAQLLPVDFVPRGAGSALAEQLASAHEAADAGSMPDAPDFDPIREAAARIRSSGRIGLTVNVVLSIALHASATLFFLEAPETVQVAGGEPVSVVILGSDAFEDAAVTGQETSAEVAPQPVEPEAVQPEALQPAPVQPATAEPPPPVPAEPAKPVRAAEPVEPNVATPNGVVVAEPIVPEATEPTQPAPPETAQAPVVEPVTAAEQPVETAEAIEPLPDPIENAPVPTPRPEYTPPPPREVARQEPRPAPQQAQPASGARGNAEANQQRGSSSGQAAQGSAQEGTRQAARANAAGNAAVSNYPGQIVTRLRRGLRYPAEARRDRLSGEVHVSFTVSANGGVGGISVVRSSGYPVLDQAAIATVQRAAPFPAIPEAAGRGSWPFTVPLAFTR